MTKSKNTKRALLASVLSVMLCVAMLVGSTFAWFTDSVTSGKNQIVAGNLDVELEYTTDFNEWKTVESATDLFNKDALWEPGHAEVVYLRMRNAGTLALKYKFGMNIVSEPEATNVNGDKFKLSQYLQYGVVEGQQSAFADRNAAIAAVANPTSLANYTKEGTMLAKAEPQYLALVVYMPETVGNEANYRGEVVPTIELGLNLVATQTPYENDSFGSDYDANVEYDGEVSTEASLVAAMEKGGAYKLAKDINLTQPVNIADGTTVVLNLNGKNLSYDSDYAILNKGDLTIDGDGSIKGRGGIKSTAGKLTINGGIYTASSDYTQGSYQHALKAENTEVVINGGTFGNDSAKPNATINVAGGSNVTINGGTFKNVTGALSRFDPYLFTYEKDGKLIINDGTFYGGWRFNAAAATTDIYGGNFTVTYDGQSFNAGNTHVLTVYGGNFTPVTGVTTSLANKLSDVVADGYSIVDNADGTKTVLESGISGDIDNEVGDPFGD